MFVVKFSFEFGFTSIFSLLIGIIFGIFITFLIYVNAILKNINKEINFTKKQINKENASFEIEKEVLAKIEETKEKYKYKTKKQKIKGSELLIPFSNGKLNKDSLTYDLINSIAFKFNPDSKMAISELTVEESIIFIKNLTYRIEKTLSLPSIHFLKKMKINTIMNIINVVDYIEKNKIFKIYNSNKKYLNIILFITKILNPVTWIKKFAIEPVIKLLSGKIISSLIEFIGLEALCLYSKYYKDMKGDPYES